MADPDDFFGEDNDNNVRKWVRTLVEPCNDMGDAWEQLRVERWLSNSVGAQLDMIGRRVRLSRSGLDDATYQKALGAAIATNISSGRFEDIIGIAELIVLDPAATIELSNLGTGVATVRIGVVALTYSIAQLLISLLRRAADMGVRLVLIFQTGTAVRFRFKRFDTTSTSGTGFRKFSGVLGGRLDSAIV